MSVGVGEGGGEGEGYGEDEGRAADRLRILEGLRQAALHDPLKVDEHPLHQLRV